MMTLLNREFGMEIHTATFKRDNQEGPTVQHMELCSRLCGSLDGRGVWGRMDTCICMAQFPCYPPETITTLLISYTLTQNKKFKKRIYHQITIVYVLMHFNQQPHLSVCLCVLCLPWRGTKETDWKVGIPEMES